jgi:hypothetical protein
LGLSAAADGVADEPAPEAPLPAATPSGG